MLFHFHSGNRVRHRISKRFYKLLQNYIYGRIDRNYRDVGDWTARNKSRLCLRTSCERKLGWMGMMPFSSELLMGVYNIGLGSFIRDTLGSLMVLGSMGLH
jgi:hypothetical protein